MLTELITLIFIFGLIYEIFLTPLPEDEDEVTLEEYAKISVFNIGFCMAGIFLTNIFSIIEYLTTIY